MSTFFDESTHPRGGDPANPGRFSSRDAGRASPGQLDDAYIESVVASGPPTDDDYVNTAEDERRIMEEEDRMNMVWDGPNP